MKTVNKEKAIQIAQIITSLRQPLEYVIGASLIIAQDQCFHFNTSMSSFEDEDGKLIKHFKCLECGKLLTMADLKSFMI